MFLRAIVTCRSLIVSVWVTLGLLGAVVPGAAIANTIIVLGDSLSSGYGLPIGQSWVSGLEARLSAEGYGYGVVNASIPGDTSSGGLARLPNLLAAHRPDIVIVELGGNDGLRGQPVTNLRANLVHIIEQIREAGAEAILVGIQIPPNYGPGYTNSFSGLYLDLAAELDIPLVNFLLEGVALDDDLMQPDGMHPNARGNEIMLENVWAVLAGLL